jgi:hypothetical protein
MSDVSLPTIIAAVERAEGQSGQLKRDLRPLRAQLEVVLRSPVRLLPIDQNDSCNSLDSYFQSDGLGVRLEDLEQVTELACKCTVRISWVDPYAAVVWRKTDDGRLWTMVPVADLPPGLEGLPSALQRYLESIGYIVLAGAILREPFPGHVSELDDSPATVYQVLFSEFY